MEFKDETGDVTISCSSTDCSPITIYGLYAGNLPKYYHLRPDGTCYSYHLPDYYAWGKRKANKK